MENQETHVAHSNEDARMEYYREMYRFMNFSLPLPTTKEEPDMKELQRKIKRFLCVLEALSNHEWSAGIAEIQEAWGIYLLANKIDEKRVKRMNEAVGTHLQFLVQMAENRAVMKQLYGIMNVHYGNITEMVKKAPL